MSLYSEVLGLSTSMTVILPQQTSSQIGMTNHAKSGLHPTLFLARPPTTIPSGRRTSIERYVAEMGIAVVMPQVHRASIRTWNTAANTGPSSARSASIARSFFPLSHAREDNFVAACPWADTGIQTGPSLSGSLCRTASLSGALDMAGHIRRNEALFEHQLVYGDQDITGTDNDLLWSLQEVERSEGPSRRYINAVEPKTSSMKTIKHSARLRRNLPRSHLSGRPRRS